MLTLVFAEAGYQSNWLEVLGSGFMRNAFIGGALVAIAAGLLGYFVVDPAERVRRACAGAHRLPGCDGGDLVGAPVTAGLAVFCVGGGLAIGFLGKRLGRPRGIDRHDPGLRHRPRRAVQLAREQEREHGHQRAVRQPAWRSRTDQLVVFAVFTRVARVWPWV